MHDLNGFKGFTHMDRKEEFLRNCIVLDTETTSLDFRVAEVIELGYAFKLDDDWHQVSNLYKAASTISPEISAITHITEKMVAGCQFFGKAIEGDLNIIVDNFVGVGNFVAHNAFYDSSVMKNYSLRDIQSPWLCTMRIAKKLYGDDDTVTQFNLPYLRYRLDLDIPEDMPHHRAGTDAYMTAKLLAVLVDEMVSREIINDDSDYKSQIEEYMAKPVAITKMPFGKHKGKKLEEVPLSYWTWALDNLDTLNEDKDEYDADFATSVAIAVDKML